MRSLPVTTKGAQDLWQSKKGAFVLFLCFEWGIQRRQSDENFPFALDGFKHFQFGERGRELAVEMVGKTLSERKLASRPQGSRLPHQIRHQIWIGSRQEPFGMVESGGGGGRSGWGRG